jgi:hypothetical protein
MDLRAQVLLSDVEGFAPDALALQEVDEKWFVSWWQPQLSMRGYSGAFAAKRGSAREGLALFWKQSRLRPRGGGEPSERAAAAAVSTAALSFGAPAYVGLPLEVRAFGEARPHLEEALQKVTSVVQIGVFDLVGEDEEEAKTAAAAAAAAAPRQRRRSVAIANTHLFFANGAPHVRLLQAAMALEAVRLRHESDAAAAAAAPLDATGAAALAQPNAAAADAAGAEVPLVLCGDLNADPRSGCLRFLANGGLDSSDACWRAADAFRWTNRRPATAPAVSPASFAAAAASGSDAAVAATPDSSPPLPLPPPPTLRHALALRSALDPAAQLAADDLPSDARWPALGCTHATSGYRATLDWVFFDASALGAVRVAPLPTLETTGRAPDAPLPDSDFPGSDHLAVCADLAWLR